MRLPDGITRNVFVLGVVSFFTDAASEMLYPVVPIFLTQTLGATPGIVGLIEGITEATASLLRIWSGWFSDKIRKSKPLIFAGYGLSALSRPLLAIAYGWPMVLLARFVDRFGKGVRGAPRDALIADSVEPRYRGRAFGFHRSMDQLGAVAGPLIGVALLARFSGDLRMLFLFAFIPSALSVIAIAFAREAQAVDERPLPRLTFSGQNPLFLQFLLVAGIFALGNSSDAFLILRAQQLGFSTAEVVVLFAAYNAVYVVSAYPAGHLSDRIPRHFIFAGGLALFAMIYFAVGVTQERNWLWILLPAYGVYMGMTDGVSRALVSDLVPVERRATALGLHAAVLGFAALPASAFAGLLWDRMGASAPFLFGSMMAAVAAIASMFLFSNARTSQT